MVLNLARTLSAAGLVLLAFPLERGSAQQTLGDLSPELARSLRAAVVEATYRVREDGDAWQAPNPAQGMRSRFTGAGVEVRGDDWTLGLSLEAWGREGALSAALEGERVVDGRRVEYRREGITEWYVNDQRGLEQGFTIESAPDGPGPLQLVLSVDGAVVSVAAAAVTPHGAWPRSR